MPHSQVRQVIRYLLRPEYSALLASLKPPLASLLATLLDHQLRASSSSSSGAVTEAAGRQDAPTAPSAGDGLARFGWMTELAACIGRAVVTGSVALPSAVGKSEERGGGEEDGDDAEGRGEAREDNDDDTQAGADNGPSPLAAAAAGGGKRQQRGAGTRRAPAAAADRDGPAAATLVSADPSASLLCGAVLSMIRSKKLQGSCSSSEAAMGCLAGLASEAWVGLGAGEGVEAGLGAVYMMSALGFKGVNPAYISMCESSSGRKFHSMLSYTVYNKLCSPLLLHIQVPKAAVSV